MPTWLTYAVRLIITPRSTKTMEWHMLRLLNHDRKIHRCKPLRMQDDLRRVARRHSRDMAKQDYFAHENKAGLSPSDRNVEARVTDTTTGENLAKIRGHKHPTQFAQDALMKSPGHRKNILNPAYNCVGIGIVQSQDGSYYSTQNFAKRALFLSVPHRFRRKGTLRIRGKTVVAIHTVLIREKGIDTPLFTVSALAKNQKVSWQVQMPPKKTCDLEVLTSEDGRAYVVANRFTVKQGLLF